MAESQSKLHLSPLTLKLIFKDGKMPQTKLQGPASIHMNEEAISVCNLLAIDPEDIMPRDLTEFQDDGKKVSNQRLQLRFEYYEEKRQLKIKAIENILVKCQTTKNGQTSLEGQQVLTLLKDINNIQTPKKRQKMKLASLSPDQHESDYKQDKWCFMDQTPHSPNKRPFVGGAIQQFNSGVIYKKIIASTPAVKAQRVLDRLPNNIIDKDGQYELHAAMHETFLTGVKPIGFQSQMAIAPKDTKARGAQSTQREKPQINLSTYDTYNHGFDLPAGVQLNRINQKMQFWELTQSNLEQKKADRELWAKNILKKEDKKLVKIGKNLADNDKQVAMNWGKHHQAREARITVYKTNEKIAAKEVWEEVNQYYKDVDSHYKNKAEREQKIKDDLAKYYDGAMGKKAQDDAKKEEKKRDNIERGYKANQQILDKLNHRQSSVVASKDEFSILMKGKNEFSSLRKYDVYEQDELNQYNLYNKNVTKDTQDDKTLKKQEKELKKFKLEQTEMNTGKRNKVAQFQKEENIEKKIKKEEFDEKWREKEETVKKLQQKILNQKKQVVEKHRLNEKDVNQNQEYLATMKSIRNFRILEKHAQKSKKVADFSTSLSNISKLQL